MLLRLENLVNLRTPLIHECIGTTRTCRDSFRWCTYAKLRYLSTSQRLSEKKSGGKKDEKEKGKNGEEVKEKKKYLFQLLQTTISKETYTAEGDIHELKDDANINKKGFKFEKPVNEIILNKPNKARLYNSLERAEFEKKAIEAAASLGINVEETKKDMLKALSNMEVTNRKARNLNLQSVLNENKGDKEQPSKYRRPSSKHTTFKSIQSGLKIFTKSDMEKPGIHLQIWHELDKKALAFEASSPPRNYFEELINWTVQGKLWHFPIDNEQGLEEEKQTDFTDHIFLEQHLESWCPKTGPLRHFMELVTVGLSRNYHISAMQKKENIMWFKNYFESKRKLLEEIGALNASSVPAEESKNVQKSSK